MAAATATNPPASVESKTARKKKAKADAAGGANSGSATPTVEAAPTPVEATASGVDDVNDSPYLKELNKNIRNTHKKLNAYAKTDAVLAANPGKSLDELVAEKKINADQKASILKKPALQSQLQQLEEQVSQYKQFGKHYEDRFAAEKAALEEAHKAELEKAKQEAAVDAQLIAAKKWEDDLLVLSQFLYAAAAKRQQSDETEENRAFESLLTMVYQGNMSAVAAIQKLVTGAEDSVMSLEGDLMDCTYAQVKQLSFELAPAPEEPTDEAPAEPDTVPAIVDEDAAAPPTSDPTIANAGLTELEETTFTIPNGTSGPEPTDSPAVPEQASIDAGAANAVAETSWDPNASASTTGEGWVEVPRDPAETDTGLANTPAAPNHSNSWAEDVPEEGPAAAPANETAENDGFEQVVHHSRPSGGRGRGGRGEFRGRGRGGEGGWRGRGGGYRGDRGERGEYRGRGRGRGEGGYRGRGGRGRDSGNTEPTGNGA